MVHNACSFCFSTGKRGVDNRVIHKDLVTKVQGSIAKVPARIRIESLDLVETQKRATEKISHRRGPSPHQVSQKTGDTETPANTRQGSTSHYVHFNDRIWGSEKTWPKVWRCWKVSCSGPFFNNGRRLAPLPCPQCSSGFRKQELIQGKEHPGRDISTLSVSKTVPGRIASSECALVFVVPSLNTIFFFLLHFELCRVEEMEQNITRRV